MDEIIERIYRDHSRKVLATLVRLLGDFDRAEEALHDAFMIAAQQWPVHGVPQNPSSWLISAGRFRALDRLRRNKRFTENSEAITESLYPEATQSADLDPEMVKDDFLRLVFVCCHPALPADAQLALALREVCGLRTEEIARAFFAPAPTIAQRIVRAKNSIKDLQLPFALPEPADIKTRLERVLHVIYLMFNEGYAATQGDQLIRADLSVEAIRLGQLLSDLVADAEVLGLVALMLFQQSRSKARVDAEGQIILLPDQNRNLWDMELISKGSSFLNRAWAGGDVGHYCLQAAIAQVHATARSTAETNWDQIVRLYDMLLQADPSPIVQLNRAVAIAERDGAQTGLALLDALSSVELLSRHHLYHAARADVLRQLGQWEAAQHGYETALRFVTLEPERKFLEKRLRDLTPQNSN